jgi:hypothetical protein
MDKDDHLLLPLVAHSLPLDRSIYPPTLSVFNYKTHTTPSALLRQTTAALLLLTITFSSASTTATTCCMSALTAAIVAAIV